MSSVHTSDATELSDILIQEQAAVDALLETVEAERRAIKSLAIAEFHPINVRRIAILEQLRALSDRRDRTVQRIVHGTTANVPPASLHALLDGWEGGHAGSIRRRYDALLTTAKHVREEIKQNVVLIEGVRGFVEQALSAGTTLATDTQTYGRTGKPAAAATSPIAVYQQG